MRLPATVPPRAGQALDSYLETVAETNDLTTAELLRLVTDPGGASTRFLTLQPSSLLLARLADLTDTSPDQLKAMTLAGLPHHERWDLTGFDPDARHAFTSIGNRGWLRTHGSQLCPACLDDTGAWQFAWRLQTTTCCTRHHTYLATHCPTCRRPFRDQRSTPLRPVGAALTCGNARGHGRDARCRRDLTRILTLTAPDDELDRQHHHDHALAGATDNLLGEPVAPSDYLAETRHLACLLLHLAGQPGAPELAPWAAEIQHLHGGGRTPWATKPPDDSRHRSLALTEAHRILTAPTRDKAADRLTPWILLIPRGAEGPIGWASDRIRLTPPRRPRAVLQPQPATQTQPPPRLQCAPHPPAERHPPAGPSRPLRPAPGWPHLQHDRHRTPLRVPVPGPQPSRRDHLAGRGRCARPRPRPRTPHRRSSQRPHPRQPDQVGRAPHPPGPGPHPHQLPRTRDRREAPHREVPLVHHLETLTARNPHHQPRLRPHLALDPHARGLLATTPAPTGNEPGFRAQYKRFAATLTSEHQSELRRALRRDQH